jgi:hypothetical protein
MRPLSLEVCASFLDAPVDEQEVARYLANDGRVVTFDHLADAANKLGRSAAWASLILYPTKCAHGAKVTEQDSNARASGWRAFESPIHVILPWALNVGLHIEFVGGAWCSCFQSTPCWLV